MGRQDIFLRRIKGEQVKKNKKRRRIAVVSCLSCAFIAVFAVFLSRALPLQAAAAQQPLSVEEEALYPALSSLNFTVAYGDVLGPAIARRVADTAGAYAAVQAITPYFNPRYIRPGQTIQLGYAQSQGEEAVLKSVVVPVSFEKTAFAIRNLDGSFRAGETVNYLETRREHTAAVVDSSLYQAGLDAGVPENKLMEMFDLFAFDIDFQRDIQPNDRFELIYERQYDTLGRAASAGNLLAARLVTGATDHKAYRFQTRDSEADYYDERGRSVKKALLLTPVQGGRLTSGFRSRRNPLYGYTEFHPALDFAAPIGTPIMAGGNGTVIRRGWDPRGYGNYVMLRHNNGYVTLYGHMSRFAARAPVGARVSQGQTIGYVGSTGMSTGPHVHYEIRYNNKQLNPAVVVRNMSSGRTLRGEELAEFKELMEGLASQFNS